LLLNDVLPQTPTCIKADVTRLNEKRSELSHNKHGDLIILLFQEPFFVKLSILVVEQSQPTDESVEVHHKVVAKAKSGISVRNVNKKLKR